MHFQNVIQCDKKFQYVEYYIVGFAWSERERKREEERESERR